jgi:hypothetical protein
MGQGACVSRRLVLSKLQIRERGETARSLDQA